MWDRFHCGVCYYPEHWDQRRHASDIQRMAAAGFDLVRLGEGAWAYFEPEEGRYRFDVFDGVIDLCRRHGIKVIMGTPTYCAPAWVSHRYPEVLRWDFHRAPMKHGGRRNFNYTSAKYLDLSDRICTALAKHYRGERQIIGWQLDNEFNCHMDTSYAPSDTAAFRAWLKRKYRTLDRLNAAWGTRFWSQTYSDWEQIDLPHPTVAYMNPSQLLDESRFISDTVVRFARRQAQILRRHNPRWLITHNGLFGNVDGPELMKALDFFSHDQYPAFSSSWEGAAAGLQVARSLSFPFAILEQQSGPGGQMEYFHATPRPGQMRLWAWQSIAHGAKLLSFFRWRTCPYGSEQHWHGLLDADDRDNRRLAEAVKLGEEARALPRAFFDAPPAKCAAVLCDFDNGVNDRRINTYTRGGAGEGWRWMAEFSRRHISVDQEWTGGDWRGYRLLVAPHLKIVDKGLVSRLGRFVRAGGALVLTAQAGSKDRNCHIVEMPLPGLLRGLAGTEIEDWTTLADGEMREARMAEGAMIALGTFVERIRPVGAEVLARWISDDPLLEGAPAITMNRVGRGAVYYIGGYCPDAAVAQLVRLLAASLDLRPVLDAPPEVEVVKRTAGRRSWYVLLNHSQAAQRVEGLPVGTELIGHQSVDGELVLAPCGVGIVQC